MWKYTIMYIVVCHLAKNVLFIFQVVFLPVIYVNLDQNV